MSTSENVATEPGNNSGTISERDLRISPQPILAVLLIAGPVLYAVAEMLSYPWGIKNRVVDLALLLQALSVAGWMLFRWNDWAGRWFTILSLVVVFLVASLTVGTPGSLALMAIPVALAAPLIGVSAATATALGETLLLIALQTLLPTVSNPPSVAIALVVIWATLGAMYAVYRPIYEVVHWSWEYFQQAHGLLEETREHRAELSQALEDLAHANAQLTRLNIVAQGLRQAAEEARAAKEQFVANVSHELRTPLNMVVGFSEIILRAPETYGDNVPASLLADLEVIHRNAAHLSDLIDDVLELSQIEAKQVALTKEFVRLCELVEAASVAVRPIFDSKSLYLEADVPESLPPVFCDRTRIREVLLNLLSNAGRFTEHGGVRVRAWQEENDILVSVTDTGPGIARGDLAKLFEPFQQLDSSIRRRYAGTGLGLSISKQFVELHGGKIWAESEKGVGTAFFFRLPLVPLMPLGDGYRRGLRPGWEYLQRTRPVMAPRTVVRPRLVVLEHWDSLRRLLTRYLDGMEIVSATSLDEAMLELSDNSSQALLINDTSVANALQRLESVRLPYGMPVMACSIPGAHKSAAALGVSDYLVKPVSREVLLETLKRLDLQGNTVLIVDDEPEALRLFQRMLTSSGSEYRVLRARDGQEAMNILRTQRPDVILLDLVMPTMDGFQLLEARSHDPELGAVPIVVISARDPAGQPIVSNALAITRGGGLSVYDLLTHIKAVSGVFSTKEQSDDPTPIAMPSG